MQSNLLLTRLFNAVTKNPFRFVHFPLILYWTFILIMTSIPIDKIPKYFDAQDKMVHFIAYFFLGVLFQLSNRIQKKVEFIRHNSVIVSILVITLYAAFDELHQLFIPGRYCDFYDWLFDCCGGITGILLMNSMSKKII
ncbi:MAG: VanZ family protein [Bacteroidota bacterium]